MRIFRVFRLLICLAICGLLGFMMYKFFSTSNYNLKLESVFKYKEVKETIDDVFKYIETKFKRPPTLFCIIPTHDLNSNERVCLYFS